MSNPIPVVVSTAEKFFAQFRTPAGAVAALTAVVAIVGEVGILSAPVAGAIQTVLSAVLGLIVAAGGGKAAQMGAKRAAAKALAGR